MLSSYLMQFLSMHQPLMTWLIMFFHITIPLQHVRTSECECRLLDQQTYQDDPVSQAVLNILGTPDYTYCMNYDSAQTFTAGCTYLYETLVSANVVGTIPDAKTFFNSAYIQQFLNQLNSNALTGPLMYSTEAPPMPQTNNQGIPPNDGLNAQNQEELAANFIRYVTGGVVPIKLPKWKDYDTLYSQAISNPNNSNTPSTTQMQAQQTLARYLAAYVPMRRKTL